MTPAAIHKSVMTPAALCKLKIYKNDFGIPESIYTDNRTQFTAMKWKKELSELNMKPLLIAIRNPCCNLTERVNRL